MDDKKLDLRNPPAGATHVDMDPGRVPSFMMQCGAQWYYWPGWRTAVPEWLRWNRCGDMDGSKFVPLASLWNGEGLPPVGAEIEVLWSSTDPITYVKALVVGEHAGRAVFCFLTGERQGEYQAERRQTYNSGALPNFRPIRTAEQLAAEEGEKRQLKQLNETVDTWWCAHPDARAGSLAAALYDAGYRKVDPS